MAEELIATILGHVGDAIMEEAVIKPLKRTADKITTQFQEETEELKKVGIKRAKQLVFGKEDMDVEFDPSAFGDGRPTLYQQKGKFLTPNDKGKNVPVFSTKKQKTISRPQILPGIIFNNGPSYQTKTYRKKKKSSKAFYYKSRSYRN